MFLDLTQVERIATVTGGLIKENSNEMYTNKFITFQ